MQDADWAPVSEAERQATGVSIGSGLSCTSELAEAGSFALQGLVRKCAPDCSLSLKRFHTEGLHAVLFSGDCTIKPCMYSTFHRLSVLPAMLNMQGSHEH